MYPFFKDMKINRLDVQQGLAESKDLEVEITKVDSELLPSNDEMKSAECVSVINEDTVVNDLLIALRESLADDEDIVASDLLARLKESLADFEYDNTEEDVDGGKDYNLLDTPESKEYELKDEEMDITYPSVQYRQDVDLNSSSLPDGVPVIEGPSRDPNDNLKMKLQKNCDSYSQEIEKQGESIEINELSTEALTQRQKHISFCCFHCDYSTNIRRNLVRHMVVHRKRKKEFYCTNCDFLTSYKCNLVRHMSVHCKEKKAQHEGTIFSCDLCSFKTHDEISFKYHTTNKHFGNDMFSCTCCKKHFRDEQLLDDHIQKSHQIFINLINHNVYNCLKCEYKTTAMNYLRCHNVKVHSGNDEKLSCTWCKKQFKHKCSLDDHIVRIHENFINLVNIKVYSCPICGYRTAQKSHFDRHTRRIHSRDYENHFCPSCKKGFKSKTALDDHILKNHQIFINLINLKVYNCPKCEYKATDKNRLRYHNRKAHLVNFKKHSCRWCKIYFKKKCSLDDHIVRIHENLISSVNRIIYSCPTCGYRTVVKNHFERHTQRVH